MKPFLAFLALLFLNPVESFRQEPRIDLLQKAFLSIAEDLTNRNHLVSVVMENVSSKASEAAAVATSYLPHISVKWNMRQTKAFELNSTAIVVLESMASVIVFSNRTLYPMTFSLTVQLLRKLKASQFQDFNLQ